MNNRALFAIASCFLMLSACGAEIENKIDVPMNNEDRLRARNGKLLGEEGITLFGGSGKGKAADSGVGVNSYLWRATLDTISFMPLAQVETRGGVIITEWYENPNVKGERLKLNVVVLDSALKSDAVKVTVFRQIKRGNNWEDAKASEDTANKLEEKILTRARELRLRDRG
jgi:hypothetical protein